MPAIGITGGISTGEGASPDSFFPSFRPAIAQLTSRGNRRICLMKTKSSPTKTLVNRSSRHCGRVAALLIALALACFGLSPQAHAVCQHGCDTNAVNTYLGDDALVNNTSGSYNTAIGAQALFSNITGSDNTASGELALGGNTTGYDNTASGLAGLYSNTTGAENTANGSAALVYNTTGGVNTRQRSCCVIQSCHRQRKHGHRCLCTVCQHHRRFQHR